MHHRTPAGDEGSYLSLARNIFEGKGFINSVVWHYYHKNESLPYPEDTRFPLYPLCMAALFFITDTAMAPAQWLNVLFNLISIVVLYCLGKKLHSESAGLLAAFFTAIAWPQIKYASSVYAEALFELLVLLLLLFYARITVDHKDTKGHHWAIGILTGLAYLCRSNGIFLFVAAIVTGFVYNRKSVGPIVGGFLVAGGWWMIRNAVVFGNPFYGHINYFMWVDSHQDLWYTILDAPPALAAYLRTHTAAALGERLIKGIAGFASELWKFEGISLVLPKMVAPFFIYFIIRRRYRQTVWIFIGIHFIITVLPLVWIAAVLWIARYVLFYEPLYFLAVSIGFLEMKKPRIKGVNTGSVSVFVMLLCIAALNYHPLRFLVSSRNGDQRQNETIEKQTAWVNGNVPENAVILGGALTQNQYRMKPGMIAYPMHEPLERAMLFSKTKGVTHFLVDRQLVQRAPALRTCWRTVDSGIIEAHPPANLHCIHDAGDFLVYTVGR